MEILSDMAAVIEEQDAIIAKQQDLIRRLESDAVQLLEMITEGKRKDEV